MVTSCCRRQLVVSSDLCIDFFEFFIQLSSLKASKIFFVDETLKIENTGSHQR